MELKKEKSCGCIIINKGKVLFHIPQINIHKTIDIYKQMF